MVEKRTNKKRPQYDACGNMIKVGQIYRYGDTIDATVQSIGAEKVRMEFKQDGVPKKWKGPVDLPLGENFRLKKDV